MKRRELSEAEKLENRRKHYLIELKRLCSSEDMKNYENMDNDNLFRIYHKLREQEEREIDESEREVKKYIREKKKQDSLNAFIKKWLKETEEKEKRQKGLAQASKDKYKQENCASLQVFLPKELVANFKAVAKLSGNSQAKIIGELIKLYVEIEAHSYKCDKYREKLQD